jgi:AraC-like DNA-binding protein
MVLWQVQFQTFRGLAGLPQARTAASEVQRDPGYHHEGRYRAQTPHCLFKYTLSGRGVFRDEAGEHAVEAGSGFLCRVHDPATAYYYPPDAQAPWRFVYLTFAGGASEQAVGALVDRHGPVFALSSGAQVLERIEAWRGYAGTWPTLSASQSAGLVWELLGVLTAETERRDAVDPGNRLAGRAQKLVRDRIDENLSVTELARALGVSREHLTRVFKEQTAQTPYRYILRQKMLLACQLLKETSLTHKEIAARLGYDTPAHFTRTFKNVLRMTPSHFRRIGAPPVL